MSLIDRMKKARAERESRFSTGSNKNPALYPILDLQIGQSAMIRFLPALDSLYDEPWTVRKLIPMVFADPLAPNDDKKIVRFSAPCLEMYGPQYVYQGLAKGGGCPVLRLVRELYAEAKEKTEAGETVEAARLKGVADRHWISKSTQVFYQGFVLKSNLSEQSPPENPIRIFQIVSKLHTKIDVDIYNKNDSPNPFKALPFGEFSVDDCIAVSTNPESLSDERANAIVEGFNGFNFIVAPVAHGKDERTGKPYRDWTTGSSWDREQTMLTDEQIEAIAKYGFHDLRATLPKQPSEQKYERMLEMMEVSFERAFGTGDGMWNPEWEKPFADGEEGCSPYRPKDKKEEGEEGSAPAQTGRSTVGGGKPAGSVASRLAASRGAKKADAAPETTPVAEEKQAETVAPTSTPEPTPAATTTSTAQPGVSDVIANIRAKIGTKKATTA
jgi:hypothetical protein